LKPENIDQAITVFNRALEKDPHYALAFAGLGEAYGYKYYYTKNSAWVAKSRSACEQAIFLQGEQAEGHICLGEAFGRIGEYEKAAVQFRRAIELEPTNDFAHTGLAEAHEGLGNAQEAEKTYLRAISLRPNYSAGYNSLGAFYFNHGRYAEAARMFERMVAIAPDSFVGYQNLGGVYVIQGRYREAIPVLERSVSIRPTAGASSNLGTAYFDLRRYLDAARLYEEAVKLSGQEFELRGNLGDAYYWASGMRDKAADAYRQAISLASRDLTVNPRDAKTLSFVAYYHAMLGEKQPALSTLERAVQVDPHNVELLLNAALIDHQVGDAVRTLEWLEKALAAGLPPAAVRNTPNFDALRDNPRFQALMKKY
jgi:eukaryotic-like serine/threonine-protein kinase